MKNDQIRSAKVEKIGIKILRGDQGNRRATGEAGSKLLQPGLSRAGSGGETVVGQDHRGRRRVGGQILAQA